MEIHQIERTIVEINKEIKAINEALDEVRMRVEKTHMDLILTIEPNCFGSEKIECQKCFEK